MKKTNHWPVDRTQVIFGLTILFCINAISKGWATPFFSIVFGVTLCVGLFYKPKEVAAKSEEKKALGAFHEPSSDIRSLS